MAELGAAIPRSGGQYNFSRRAIGDYAGFIVGWSDWLSSCGTLAAVAIVIGEYSGKLIAASCGRKRKNHRRRRHRGLRHPAMARSALGQPRATNHRGHEDRRFRHPSNRLLHSRRQRAPRRNLATPNPL